MSKKPGIIHRIVTGTWTAIDQSRRALVNVIFLALIYLLVMSFIESDIPRVDANTILVIKPVGYIVDELDYVPAFDEALDELREANSRPPQTLLSDLLKAMELGRKDDNVSALFLDLGSMFGAEPSKLQEIAKRINAFRNSGKRVYAYAESYGQSQYYLASHADEVMMDSMGSVFIEGYGRFNTYFKGALEKLGIKTHVFKVGTYKSAVEPYIREDMSDQAKEANLGYLNDLWQAYKNDVVVARSLSADTIQNYSDEFLLTVSQSSKDLSGIAVEQGFIDRLLNRQELKQYLMDEQGSNRSGDSYRGMLHERYLAITAPKPLIEEGTQADTIAVVVAKGVILNGKQKAGTIGGQSTSALIRKARKDPNVKALVLRVDSPGGSAYASEMIRREVIATQTAGKPVIVSMGSYAASGGYWISANADEIWASPTTITGSIGIFGLLATFEDPLTKIGIHRDGVGTTKLSGAFDLAKPLRDDVAAAIQRNIENGYQKFLSLVAEGRNMSVEAVDEIAQGRVWSGTDALELGLVDKLGDLDQAVASAATLAGLVNYEVKTIKHPLTPTQQLMDNLFSSQISRSLLGIAADETQLPMQSVTNQLVQQLDRGIRQIQQMDDPNNMYAHCLCNIN